MVSTPRSWYCCATSPCSPLPPRATGAVPQQCVFWNRLFKPCMLGGSIGINIFKQFNNTFLIPPTVLLRFRLEMPSLTWRRQSTRGSNYMRWRSSTRAADFPTAGLIAAPDCSPFTHQTYRLRFTWLPVTIRRASSSKRNTKTCSKGSIFSTSVAR